VILGLLEINIKNIHVRHRQTIRLIFYWIREVWT